MSKEMNRREFLKSNGSDLSGHVFGQGCIASPAVTSTMSGDPASPLHYRCRSIGLGHKRYVNMTQILPLRDSHSGTRKLGEYTYQSSLFSYFKIDYFWLKASSKNKGRWVKDGPAVVLKKLIERAKSYPHIEIAV